MHKTGGLLKRTLLSDLIFDKKELIQVEVKDSLEHVLNVLKTNEILSVPVYDAKKCQYVGVVDTFDIMTMISLGAFIKGMKVCICDILMTCRRRGNRSATVPKQDGNGSNRYCCQNQEHHSF